MSTAERIIQLTVKTDRAVQEMQKLNKKVDEGARGFGKMGDIAKNALKGFAAAITVTAVSNLTKESLKFAETMQLASEKIGVSAEQLQVFQEAAARIGMDAGAAETALQRFARRSAEAAKGTGVLYKEFKELGIATRDSNGNMRKTGEILADYADAVQKTASPQERLRLSVQAFDTEGGKLVNTLSKGSEGFRELAEEMRATGQLLDNELIEKTAEINAQWEALTRRITTQMRQITLEAADFWAGVFGVDLETNPLAKVEKELAESLKRIAEIKANPIGQGGGILGLTEELKELEAKVADLTAQRNKLKDQNWTLDGLEIPEEAIVSIFDYEKAIKNLKKETATKLKAINYDHSGLDAFIADLERQADAVARAVDPMYVYQKELARLKMLHDQGALSWEHYADAVFAAEDALRGAAFGTNELGKEVNSFSVNMDDVARSFTAGFADTIVDGLAKGKLAFKDFAASFAAMVAKMIIEAQTAQLLQTMFPSLFAAGTTTSGGGGGTTRSFNISGLKHQQVVQPTTRSLSISPLKNMASLKMPSVLPQMKAEPPRVTVNNYASGDGYKANVETTNNGQDISITIEKMVNQVISSGGADAAMGTRFGASVRAF